MKNYFIKTPRTVKWLMPKLVWDLPADEKEVYLTFDDGPTPGVTDFVLNELDKVNAKATFFCIGRNIKEYPELFREIIDRGHHIGNHTYHHENALKSDHKSYMDSVRKTGDIISEYTGKDANTKLFRPPYGKITTGITNQLIADNYSIIMFDVLSADFDQKIDPEKCYMNVMRNTAKGSIIVFHDSLKAADRLKPSLPRILNDLREEGYRFMAI
ncbi:polysaccharide deacetylase family protein [Robertkochia solimangrovi]|uniref:polysaccharide deacetylase family protein n=1 Tax=Robertkochia solimangrovi TaxID=2213046 RepID=UPI00117D1A34|nr:polysaccharide deacetylase family protein [Robertkochia solimangrovi]TRZ46381.1 polysaccharide deacetylase family protein [Robertkochia solimangrovi]